MAKKVVVPEETASDEKKPKKKKRNKCCTCCLIALIVVVVILAAAFGVGWYFGDKMTKQYLGMPLGDVFGVLGDMYWANDKKVVERPFDGSDLDGFYREIKRNIMLKEDAEVDFDGALDAAIKTALDTAMQSQSESTTVKYGYAPEIGEYTARLYNDDGNASGEGEGGEEQSQIMNIVTDMVVNALNRDNIDLERLNKYNENDPSTDTYKFSLNDKQLAAFIDKVMRAVLANADKIDGVKEYAGMVDLSQVVSLKQVVFSTVKDGDTVKATNAKVTVWVALQKAAGQAATGFMEDGGFGWAGPLARGLCNMILPENLYISIAMPLHGESEPYITINDMDEEERARAYKLINGIMNMNGDGESNDALTEMLHEFTDSIAPTLETATEYMDFSGAGEGTIKLDLLDTAMKMASEGIEGEQLTKADFIYVLQAFMSDPDVQLANLEPYMFRDRYLVDGEEVYIKGGDGENTAIDYEARFISEIEEKYSLDFGESTKLDDVLAMLGISLDGSNNGSMGSSDLLKLIDAKKFNALLYSENDIKLHVTDRMLGAAMSGQMNKVIGTGGLEGMDLKLDALSFVRKPSKPSHLYTQLAVEADLSGMFDSFGDNELMARLAMGLMPERLLFTVTVDITRDLAAGDTKDGVEFKLNSCENTDRALATIEKFMPSFELNEMSEQIGNMLNDMLDQMGKTFDMKFVASTYDKTPSGWTGEPGGMELPDIFTVVTDLVLVDDDGTKIVSSSQLKEVLRAINDTSGVNVAGGIAEDYSDFIHQVVDKYYLDPKTEINTFDELTSFLTAFETSKENNGFRVRGNTVGVKYMAYDTRSIDELKPVMRGDELGALIKSKMGADVADYTIESVSTGDGSLTIVLSVNVGNLLPEDVNFLLTADKLYVTANVEMDTVLGDGTDGDPYRYDLSVNLNTMNFTTYNSAMRIIEFFQPDFDIAEKVSDFGRILYDQMQAINDSFALAETGGTESGNTGFFSFTVDGLVMTDFYTFLASKTGVTVGGETKPADVKAALQGMYAYNANFPPEEGKVSNNYKLESIVFNPSDKAPAAASEGTHSDVTFNSFLRSVEGMGHVYIDQTVMIHAGDKTTAADAARTWILKHIGIAPAANTDYLMVTARMAMADYMTSDSGSTSFLPDNDVYGTIVYEYADGAFGYVGVAFNDMNVGAYNVLQQMMKLSADSEDDTKVNINTVTKATTAALKGITDFYTVAFGDKIGNEGIGSCTLTRKF